MVVKVGYIFVCLLQFISLHSCEKDFSACGLQPTQDSTLIIGPAHDPEKNPVGEWPWMASLGFYNESEWIHNCGATLIDDKHLLTAAHCFKEAFENCGETLFEDIQNLTSANCFKESINKLKIRLGVFSLNVEHLKNDPVPLDILDVSLHPKYDKTAYFDVAIIITDKIRFTKKVRPICLPSESSDNQNQYQHYHLTVTGWGSSFITGVASDTLKRAEVIGYSQGSCNRTHQAIASSFLEYQRKVSEDIPNYFQSQILCAGINVGKEGPCKGDSGGPLFYQDTDTQTFVQVGIVQGSISECGEKTTPSIYVRLSDHQIFQFINCTLSDTCSKGYTKVAVALGKSVGPYLDSIEVIDLSSSNTRCQNLQNFPYENFEAVGGLGFGDNPIFCRGMNHRSSCHSLQNGSWKPDASFKEGRDNSAMTKSPFPNDGSKLFVTGGFDDSRIKSSKVLTENGWQLSTPLPVEISSHCMVMINSTSVMVIGGFQSKSDEPSGRTFLLDGVTKVWTEGPELKQKRRYHSCAMIRKDSQSQDKSVIVVGGDYGGVLSSTEVFDVGSSEWRSGPELPFGIDEAAMVEDPSGGVVLIGGYNNERGEYLDTIFRLPHAGSDATWEKMPQKLKTARWQHTAFLIPDEIANCN